MKRILATTLTAVALASTASYAVIVNVDNPVTIADSLADFAVDFSGGDAGANGWNYGYYNYTADGDSTYAQGDFVPFTAGQTRGTGYGLVPSNAPWTFVDGGNNGHPNGTNSAPDEEHWAIRRYNIGTSGAVDVDWLLRSANGNGPGTTLHVYHNGVEVANSGAVSTTAGTTGVANLNVSPGDVIDFALSPVGNGGDRSDGSDASVFGGILSMPNTLSFDGIEIANTRTDWSGTNVQGVNGWSYGYYNLGPSGTGSYTGSLDPNSLILFDPDTHWTGSAWDLGANAPWTTIAQEGAHPNGINNVDEHWATRRYTVQPGEEGDLAVVWDLAAQNLNGLGTSVRVLVNGTEVDFESIAGNDGTGIQRGILVNGANVGDVIDISLTPEGPSGDLSDGSDGSVFGAQIYQVVPEPSVSLLLLAGAGLVLRRRRKR
jgi:hypothetical protein